MGAKLDKASRAAVKESFRVVPACVFGGIFASNGRQKTDADWEGLRFSGRNLTPNVHECDSLKNFASLPCLHCLLVHVDEDSLIIDKSLLSKCHYLPEKGLEQMRVVINNLSPLWHNFNPVPRSVGD